MYKLSYHGNTVMQTMVATVAERDAKIAELEARIRALTEENGRYITEASKSENTRTRVRSLGRSILSGTCLEFGIETLPQDGWRHS